MMNLTEFSKTALPDYSSQVDYSRWRTQLPTNDLTEWRNPALLTAPINIRTVGPAQQNRVAYVNSATTKALKEDLFDTLSSFKIKTSTVAMYLKDEWRHKFFYQLDGLLDEDSWDPDDKLPTIESFSTLLRMLLFINPERRPGLGATGDGELIAAWTVGDDRLTMRCLPNDRVRWVLSCGLGDARESASGSSLLYNLKEILSPYRPERWFRAYHLPKT